VPRVSAIVPAAGLATRMGGPNKMLLPWGSSTVLGAVVSTLLPLVDEVIVITGRDAEEVSHAAHPAIAVYNPRFKQGLGGSIAVGVGVSADSDGFLIALGDMPELSAAVVQRLFEELEPGRIVVARYEGVQGHPVLFGRNFRSELEALKGDAGGRSILNSHPDSVEFVEFGGELRDLDSPEDL
jgi:molybdenum cofactor cytidylyltransferase